MKATANPAPTNRRADGSGTPGPVQVMVPLAEPNVPWESDDECPSIASNVMFISLQTPLAHVPRTNRAVDTSHPFFCRLSARLFGPACAWRSRPQIGSPPTVVADSIIFEKCSWLVVK